MENLLMGYEFKFLCLAAGVVMVYLGGRIYIRHLKWLGESKETSAWVIEIEDVETEDGYWDLPTFKYQTTNEVLVAQSEQYFEVGKLRVDDPCTLRYNPKTPGKVLSDLESSPANAYALCLVIPGLHTIYLGLSAIF